LLRERKLRLSWIVICVVALVSAAASLSVYATHAGDFFWGDDFELIGDALEGVSPLEPVSSHLRPVIRLHFLIYRWIPSPAFFGLLSLVLHASASAAVFVALRATHNDRVALPVSLLFFGSFLANEAVFWASSAGVLYCMIFSCLSLACFARGRLLYAYALLLPAALSYELWLVVPLLFLFHYRTWRELIVPGLLAAGYLVLNLVVFSGASVASYGGFSWLELPQRFSIYAFRMLSPLAGAPSMTASLALALLVLSLAAFKIYRFPVVLYASSAMIFALSAKVASRFYYFPSLALILMLVLGLQAAKRPLRAVSALLVLYLAVASPWINGLDGEDYFQRADLHRELFDAFSDRIDRMSEGQQGMVVNRLGPDRLISLRGSQVGRPKLTFVRGRAMAGMIYPEDAVRMALWERYEQPRDARCSGARIEIGVESSVRSTYCFEIVSR
jgi:hypothetical protein